jgi:hypothetical protein
MISAFEISAITMVFSAEKCCDVRQELENGKWCMAIGIFHVSLPNLVYFEWS